MITEMWTVPMDQMFKTVACITVHVAYSRFVVKIAKTRKSVSMEQSKIPPTIPKPIIQSQISNNHSNNHKTKNNKSDNVSFPNIPMSKIVFLHKDFPHYNYYNQTLSSFLSLLKI